METSLPLFLEMEKRQRPYLLSPPSTRQKLLKAEDGGGGGWGGVWGVGGGVALSAGGPVTEKNVEKLREAESIWSPSPGADRESISAHSLGGDST